MRTREFHLSEAAIQELERAEHTAKRADDLRRLQAVRLYGTGVDLATIQAVTHLSLRSIQRWVTHYNATEVTRLRRHKPGGNNRKLTAAQRTEIHAKLHQYRPVDLQISQGQWWTVSDLQVAVERRFLYERSYNEYIGYIHHCLVHLLKLLKDASENRWNNLKLLKSIGLSLYRARAYTYESKNLQANIDILTLYDSIQITLGSYNDDLYNPRLHASALLELSSTYSQLSDFKHAYEKMSDYINCIIYFCISGKDYISIRAAKKHLRKSFFMKKRA